MHHIAEWIRYRSRMINGTHLVIHSADPKADRAFFRDVLEYPHVDVGHGWLIFKLPPAELGIHPADAPSHELFLMCDDLEATIAELEAKGVDFTQPVTDAGWGLRTTLRLPGGSELGLYQPRHDTAYNL